MSKTRANNEGNIKLRADGRYEVRVTVDYDKMTGKPKRVSKYAKTREEAVKLLNQMADMNLLPLCWDCTTPQALDRRWMKLPGSRSQPSQAKRI